MATKTSRRMKQHGTKSAPEQSSEPALIDIERVEREAAELCPDAPPRLARFLWTDAQVRQRFPDVPPVSPWWRFAIGEYFQRNAKDPSLTWFVGCCGRGSGKSTLASKWSLSEGLWTRRVVPTGEQHVYGFLSTPQDAKRRVLQLEQWIKAFGFDAKLCLSYPVKLTTTDAQHGLIEYTALTSRVGNVSGPTFIGLVVDEEAKQLSADRSQINSIDELIVSCVSATRARHLVNLRLSSPMGRRGSFYELITKGNSVTYVAHLGKPEFLQLAKDGILEVAQWEAEHGNIAGAETLREYVNALTLDSPYIPTWVANPSIGAVESRKQADATPDTGRSPLSYWLREYAGWPMPNDAEGYQWTVADWQASARMSAGAGGQRYKTLDGLPPGDLIRFPGLPSCDPRSTEYARERPEGHGWGSFKI